MTPLDLLPRFRAARAELPRLRAFETAPREVIESIALDRLNATWAHARTHVPHYRDLAPSLPSAFSSLAEVKATMPLLDKDSVREHPDRFLSETPDPGRWQRTGGSTGRPMRVFWSDRAHLGTLRARYRMLDRWGIGVLDRSAVLWGHGASVAPGLRGRADRLAQPLFDRLRRRLRLSAYALFPADLDAHLDALVRFAPRSLYGYSSAVGRLAAHAQASGVTIPSLALAVLTGEPADAALRDAVGRQLGCAVAVEYGSAETGVMASGAPDGTLRVNEDRVWLETLPTDVGAEVVVTVLSNPSFPLFRYRIGDLARAPIIHPATGFAVLPGVEGRRDDVLLGAGGSMVHASTLKQIVADAGGASRFCAHQAADGTVTVTLEGHTALDEHAVRDALVHRLGGGNVRFERSETLAGNRAGKHRWVVRDRVSRPAGEPSP